MKKLIPIYLAIAVFWAVAATAIGAGPTDGTFAYRVGRNAPRSLMWPWEVVKSPYTLAVWAFGDKRAPVLEGMYQQCRTRASASVCECREAIMKKEFTIAELEAIDASLRRGGPMPERFLAAALRSQQCN